MGQLAQYFPTTGVRMPQARWELGGQTEAYHGRICCLTRVMTALNSSSGGLQGSAPEPCPFFGESAATAPSPGSQQDVLHGRH
jgi:hypothetical protein